MDQITFNGKYAMEKNQDVMIITERCVFKLTPEGIVLTEVAPGVRIKEDILDLMDFAPVISKNVMPMPDICFYDECPKNSGR